MAAATGLSIVGLLCDFVGALLLLWPVLRPAGRSGSRFDTRDYVRSWKTRAGAILLVLGFWLQGLGIYLLGGGQR
jgi:hypothetical protein